MLLKPLLRSARYISTTNFSPTIITPSYVQPTPKKDDEIIIAMSSGVDSSVAAALYASQYQKVRGIYMANWSQTAKCTEADWNDVQKVCNQLEIPCERVNFEKEYWMDVFEPMIEMYKRGMTPNPDVGCNKYVKFGKMIQHLTKRYEGSSTDWWLVTGHYSRIMTHIATGKPHLLRSSYPNKDQSYYLSLLPTNAMDRLLMPIGHYTKPEVRIMAENFQLSTASKPDSQGLCFVSQTGNFRDFLDEYIPPNPGNIITQDGKVFGEHNGIWHATIGQKSGISMPQGDPKYKGVWFVSEKRFETNEIVIVKGRDNPALFSDKIKVGDWTWMGDMTESQLPKVTDLSIQFRSLQEPIKISEFTMNEDEVTVSFEKKQRAVAPGQNLVLYNGERVLGCGVIRRFT